MADTESIRIGQVSSINYDSGMVRIYYPDRDGIVTDELPYLTMGDEYKMPKIGQFVVVAHLSNGAEAGVVLGPYWNAANQSRAVGKGVFRKEFASAPGEAYMQYDPETETLTIKAKSIKLETEAGTFDAGNFT